MHSSLDRPRRGRRRSERASAVAVLFMLFTLASFASARAEDSLHFRKLAERGEIHVDTRPQPLDWLRRRQDTLDGSFSDESSSSSSTEDISTSDSATSTLEPSSSTETETPTSTQSILDPSVTVITTPLPSPFDSSLGSNFTSSTCPTFFTKFLTNTTFTSCTPVSLLLQTSASFFRAMRSPSLLSATLDTACAAPLSICEPAMSDFAQQLIEDANCGADFRNEQPLVLQAYNGLVAYEPIYRASCLKTAEDDDYCFASSVAESNNSADIYPYFTAIGLNMPSGATPTCTSCLKQTMQILAQYAVRKEQPLAQTYMKCGQTIDSACGEGYADLGVQVGSVDNGMQNGNQGGQGNGAGRMAGSGFAVAVAVAAVVTFSSL